MTTGAADYEPRKDVNPLIILINRVSAVLRRDWRHVASVFYGYVFVHTTNSDKNEQHRVPWRIWRAFGDI